MKKIGVLTLVFDNYGTRLQSYALCRVLNEFLTGMATVEVINMEGCWTNRNQSPVVLLKKIIKAYGWKSYRHIYELFKWVYEQRKIRSIDHSEEIAKRKSLFLRLNGMIPYSSVYYSCDDIRNGKLPQYDAIIVGSDQVWNGIKVGNQDIYMLDFLKEASTKRITYAASFGMTSFPPSQLDDYKRRIQTFQTLLVREKEAVDMCKQLGREDAQFVLDPTLLLKQTSYLGLLDGQNYQKDDYILVYSLNQSYKIYDESYKLAKKIGCKMIVLKRSFCPPKISDYTGAEEIYAVSPQKFLSLINKAKCVVTNSYHALLFSIIFHSNFYLYLNNADEENSRILTITNMLKLDEQVFWETGRIPKEIHEIDYTEADRILEYEREKSISLLKSSLSTI